MPRLTRNMSTHPRRCQGCGHRIGHRTEMAVVRFFGTDGRLKIRYYHPDCDTDDDRTGRVDLLAPSFTWREFFDSEKLYMVSMVPTNEGMTVDVVNGQRYRGMFGFHCSAMTNHRGGWVVTTMAGRGGRNRRHVDCDNEAQAREIMRRWFERRFRRFIPA